MKLKQRLSFFLRGICSVLNLFPPSKRQKIINPYAKISDAETIQKDWEIVGKDLQFAIEKMRKQIPQ